MSSIAQSPAWRALRSHHEAMSRASISRMFAADPQRFERFSLRCGELLLDYSKNLIDAETIVLLTALARERGAGDLMHAMFAGARINLTENRPVLHAALRGTGPVLLDGVDVMPQVRGTLERMREFSNDVRGGAITGCAGARFTDVINIGIGGSHLGPALATQALAPYAGGGPRVHYVSNIDAAGLLRTLATLNAAATLVIVASKTFTTQETMTNALTVRDWLTQSVGSGAREHLAAVTANTRLAAEFGIASERVFPFWDWVGGRYSLWSAVGLPVALAVGMDNFEQLLAGAREMDGHFREAPCERNMPVILALLGIWYNNFFGAATHAVLPYDESLTLLPAWLQQLDMESSGKCVTREGGKVDCDTGAVIWGAPGTDAQHSFFQLLHQGTRLIPADFVAACRPQHAVERHHAILMANFFAQTEALMNGAPDAADAHDVFPGNRPSNSILLEKLTPHALGMLLALYEHKVFVQNAVWGTNAFDQPGVELGKRLAARILPELAGDDPVTSHDASTSGLINFFKANRGR